MTNRRGYFLVLTLVAAAAAFVFSCMPAEALDIKAKSVEGTEQGEGLTDKQLAIQRWFAYLTILNDGKDGWGGWYHDETQLGLDSYRYSLAFLGYGAGAAAYKTPAYTELTAKILDNAIQRMIQKRLWQYVEHYWKKSPTFPDPVAYENIMYSGHLMQLISLYESITGDMKYSTRGWDFVWDNKTKIHYTADKLMRAIYKQVKEDERGGVACEPQMIFVICNDHPQNAFALYDAMHGTTYLNLADKWRTWMQANAPLPKAKGKDYMKISYMKDRKSWTTGFGTPGADGWALAWMYPWTSDKDFVCDGWTSMYENRKWTNAKEGGMYLKADTLAKAFGVNSPSATSFYPLVEKQCLRNSGVAPKAGEVYKYFESQFGTLADTDHDGLFESYYYKTDEKTHVWSTANIFTAMITSGDSLRDMYRTPFFKSHAGEPKLLHVDYPNVMVKKAAYSKSGKTLSFTVVRGSAKLKGDTVLVCGNIKTVKSVTRDGKPFKAYKLEKGNLKITANIQDSASFEVKVP